MECSFGFRYMGLEVRHPGPLSNTEPHHFRLLLELLRLEWGKQKVEHSSLGITVRERRWALGWDRGDMVRGAGWRISRTEWWTGSNAAGDPIYTKWDNAVDTTYKMRTCYTDVQVGAEVERAWDLESQDLGSFLVLPFTPFVTLGSNYLMFSESQATHL